ncbi:hypothetical protein, partial [Polaromonas sp.]|uniref:hypothetical protein n=1 Tax=Polaromonas sp. TaxID=1869339 RepID=UPI00272F2FD7
ATRIGERDAPTAHSGGELVTQLAVKDTGTGQAGYGHGTNRRVDKQPSVGSAGLLEKCLYGSDP